MGDGIVWILQGQRDKENSPYHLGQYHIINYDEDSGFVHLWNI
jgi:hypothetical protein